MIKSLLSFDKMNQIFLTEFNVKNIILQTHAIIYTFLIREYLSWILKLLVFF